MQIDVYATRDCFYCYQMKELLKRAELEYNLIHVMKEGVTSNNKGELYMSKEEFKHVYPHTRGFPYVIIDGEEIGGLVETAKYLIKEGLVSGKG